MLDGVPRQVAVAPSTAIGVLVHTIRVPAGEWIATDTSVGRMVG